MIPYVERTTQIATVTGDIVRISKTARGAGGYGDAVFQYFC